MQKAEDLKVADSSNKIKILGLFWEIDSDRYLYNTNFEWDGRFTKRSALRYTNRVFDPLGWLTPMSIRRRLFIQKLWDKDYKWEDNFEHVKELAELWLEIVKETHIAVTAMIARQVIVETNSELHIFSDASMEAYGAVVYVRTPPSQQDQKGLVHLASAKGKITKKKGGTVPRFELAGMVVAAHQIPFIRKAWNLPVTVQVNLWCDARVVLNWLSQYEIKETFNHNRVVQVRELCEPTQHNTTIRYVPTDMNPADILTRKQKAREFIQNETWWQGPKWLKSKENWPETEVYNLYPESWKRVSVFSIAQVKLGQTSILKFFNRIGFKAGLRVMVYILRAFNFKDRTIAYSKMINYKKDKISKAELDGAKLEAIRIMQRDMFTVELVILKRGEEVKIGHCKRKNIFLDSQGIIRSKGRLENMLEPNVNNF